MKWRGFALLGIALTIGSVGAYETGSITFMQAVFQAILLLTFSGLCLGAREV